MDIIEPELVDAFCKQLSVADLATLTSCSVRLNKIATRSLYRHIPALSPRSMVLLLLVLRRSPSYACLVRSIILQYDSGSLSGLYRLSREVLTCVTELKSLTVKFVNVQAPPSWPLTGKRGYSFQLTYFKTNYHINDHLACFLKMQPSIVEMHVTLDGWPEEPTTVPVLDFWPPDLQSLSLIMGNNLNLSTLQGLLHTPHLERVNMGISGDPLAHILSLQKPSRLLKQLHIEKLEAWSFDSLCGCFDHLPDCAPHLEWLIISTLEDTDNAFPTKTLKAVAQYLHRFKHLFHLSFLNMYGGKMPLESAEIEETRSILVEWSTACPSLRSACIRMLPLWHRDAGNKPWHTR